jgi:hypothetical protein
VEKSTARNMHRENEKEMSWLHESAATSITGYGILPAMGGAYIV